MAKWEVAICAFLLTACSPADDEATESNAIIAEAPASKMAETQPSYYPTGYAEMKVAAAVFAEENFGKHEASDFDNETGKSGVFYAVEDCQGDENHEVDESIDPKVRAFEAYAREIAKHEHYLSQVYELSVYEQPLRDYEKRLIEFAATMPPDPSDEDPESSENKRLSEWHDQHWEAKEKFADQLEERRARIQPGAMPIIMGGGCGGGETPFLVTTEPADGSLWMTTKFSFDLCRARKLDPWNTSSCRWTEMSPEKEAYLSGRYVYLASWPDGVKRSGVRAFDGSDTSGDAIKVVIRRP